MTTFRYDAVMLSMSLVNLLNAGTRTSRIYCPESDPDNFVKTWFRIILSGQISGQYCRDPGPDNASGRRPVGPDKKHTKSKDMSCI